VEGKERICVSLSSLLFSPVEGEAEEGEGKNRIKRFEEASNSVCSAVRMRFVLLNAFYSAPYTVTVLYLSLAFYFIIFICPRHAFAFTLPRFR